MRNVVSTDFAKRSERAARARFEACFRGSARVLLAVIPTSEEGQAQDEVRRARQSGFDGVFLVNAGIGYQGLLRICRAVAQRNPDQFVGVNCTDLRPQDVFSRLPEGVHGVWVDYASLSSESTDNAATVLAARHEARWDGLCFGGIPVGHQPLGLKPETGLRKPAPGVDVVTLGMVAADQPPQLEIVRRLRQALGARPLAVAGPMVPENVEILLPYVDCFLTTIGIGGDRAGPGWSQAMALAQKIHGFAPKPDAGWPQGPRERSEA
jgi:hypothetical protein